MNIPGGSIDLLTSAGVGTIAVVGGIAKGAQWRDPQSGATSWPLLASGIALSLVMATVVRAAGVHFGWEPWIQVAISGVSCYLGPDPILRALGSIAFKRFGVTDGSKDDVKKP